MAMHGRTMRGALHDRPARPGLATLLTCGLGLLPLGCAANDAGFTGANFTGDESLLDLLQFGDAESPQALIDDAMNRYNPDARASGITRIATRDFGADPVFLELYRLGAADSDAAVRAAAARAIGLHGEPQDADLLVPLLEDQDDLVRWQAAIAMQRLHNPAAVEPLIDRLDETVERNAEVRAAAATALSQYAQPRVLDALIGALDDPDLVVNTNARNALRTLTGEQLGYEPRPWVAWLRQTDDPFANREPFEYPAYQRDLKWWEHFRFWYDVPNEMAARPTGMPAPERK